MNLVPLVQSTDHCTSAAWVTVTSIFTGLKISVLAFATEYWPVDFPLAATFHFVPALAGNPARVTTPRLKASESAAARDCTERRDERTALLYVDRTFEV
jgi:hypothetical protein